MPYKVDWDAVNREWIARLEDVPDSPVVRCADVHDLERFLDCIDAWQLSREFSSTSPAAA